MLENVLDAYLETVEEREFDAPFMALLRSKGYFDIHHTHGPFEFGKDIIAKRLDKAGNRLQYGFQLKAGDVNLSGWRDLKPQLEQIIYNKISHPSFDASLPRVAVLVTTGRLTGGAGPDAQEYRRHIEERGEGSVRTWDGQDLRSDMLASPEAGLLGWVDGPLLGLVSQIKTLTEVDIEVFSRRWVEDSFPRSAVMASVLANRFREQGRLDQACLTALCLLRAALTRSQANLSETSSDSAECAEERSIASGLFHAYAQSLWEKCSPDLFTAENVYNQGVAEVLTMATYPVRCLRLVELLATLALSLPEDQSLRGNIRDYLATFIENNPGAAHPISDHWAVSLIPAAVLLGRSHPKVVENWLERIVVWVCDRYEKNAGMAEARSKPAEQIDTLLGGPLEHLEIRRRLDCQTATTVLDLTCLLGMDRLYHDALNDFMAVRLYKPFLETPDVSSQFIVGGQGAGTDLDVPYDDSANVSETWEASAHHRRAPAELALQRIGCNWEFLSVSLVLRDRYFLAPIRALIQPSEGLRKGKGSSDSPPK